MILYQLIRILMKRLKIHTNASAFQLGSVTRHKGKLIDLYGIKLNDTQQRYTVT